MNFVLSILFSSFAVIVVILIPWIGVGALDLRVLFGDYYPIRGNGHISCGYCGPCY